MTASAILAVTTSLAIALLSLALLLTAVRIVRGPTLADRVLGLDLLVTIAIGLIAVIAVRTGFSLYIDIAIALCLVGFLATVAFARFILIRGAAPESGQADGNRPGKAVSKPRRKAVGRNRKGKGR